jgi:2-oxoisovalerate dehydrogenase E2 component (dihydrolipoyl transacylase)
MGFGGAAPGDDGGMSTYVVRLPDVGEGVAEAELVEWHVNVGDVVAEDQPLADVMTDKATVELPSPVGGTIARLGAEAGDVVAIGSDLVWIETDGAAPAEAPPSADSATEAAPPPEPQPQPEPGSGEEDTEEITAATPRPETPQQGGAGLAAPAVRRRAETLGIDLADVAGSGPDGRVVHDDLDRLLSAGGMAQAARPAPAPLAPASDEVETVKITGLRRNISQRMQESKRRIPHFTYVEEVDVAELERLRGELNRSYEGARPRLTVLPLLMRAVVVAVAEFPAMNARFKDDDGVVERHRAVHLGIATQTEKGLMVPVVGHAEAREVWDLAAEVARLSAAARDGTVTLDELHGSTITITSLGALGGVVTTPVINYPEVAIIGVNKIVTRPVYEAGGWVPREMMNLSSSFDHRVVDGYEAAQFVQRIKTLLETPALLFAT